MANEIKYEMITCIVNAGFSDIVMDAAKKAGAKGGTIIHARGTANKDAEEFFHIYIEPEKDLVLLVVDASIKDAVLHNIYNEAGLDKEASGIAFSCGIDEVVGINSPSTKKEK